MRDDQAGDQVLGQIEADRFCPGCGFNLHGQRVWRDERLGLAVCRCPECGRHESADRQSTAAEPWLRRLGVALLAGWVLLVIGVVLGVGFFQFLGHVLVEESLTTGEQILPDGRTIWEAGGTYWEAYRTSDPQGQKVNISYVVDGEPYTGSDGDKLLQAASWGRVPIERSEWYHRGDDNRFEAWLARGGCVLWALVCGLLQGGVLALAMYHRRWWVGPLVAAAVPAIAAGLYLAIVHTQPHYYRALTGWATGWAGLLVLASWVGLVVAAVVTVPLVRGVLLLLLPEKTRRLFGFLWPAAAGTGA